MMPPGDTETIETNPERSLRSRRFIGVIKGVLIIAVLAALGRHVVVLIRDWSANGGLTAVESIKPIWIAASVIAFMFAQICYGLFWGHLLHSLGVPSTRRETLKAYCLGTFGKYIPGKAMVIVLRSGLVRAGEVGRLIVGLTTVYETLAMMAVGSLIAGACLLAVERGRPLCWGGAWLVAAGFLTALHPTVFGWLAKLVSMPFKARREAFSARPLFRVAMRRGWLSVAGWCFSGVSFWAAAGAIRPDPPTLTEFALLTGTAALATTVGFVVLFAPAGIGVRELVIIQLLAPRFGNSQAVLLSLLLRTIWTVAELCLAGGMYGLPAQRRTVNKYADVERAG